MYNLLSSLTVVLMSMFKSDHLEMKNLSVTLPQGKLILSSQSPLFT